MPKLPLRSLAVIYNALPVILQRAILVGAHKRFLVGVVGLGIDDEQRVVLGRHRFGTPAWRFLGGMLEAREAPHASLAREIEEETGLAVTVGPVLAASSNPRWAHVELLFAYRVSGALPSRPSAELLEVGAFALDALPPMRADHRSLVELHAPSAIAWARSRVA